MKKVRVVCLLLIICLVLGMFVGCTDNSNSAPETTDSENSSFAVGEDDFNDPFGE